MRQKKPLIGGTTQLYILPLRHICTNPSPRRYLSLRGRDLPSSLASKLTSDPRCGTRQVTASYATCLPVSERSPIQVEQTHTHPHGLMLLITEGTGSWRIAAAAWIVNAGEYRRGAPCAAPKKEPIVSPQSDGFGARSGLGT